MRVPNVSRLWAVGRRPPPTGACANRHVSCLLAPATPLRGRRQSSSRARLSHCSRWHMALRAAARSLAARRSLAREASRAARTY
eukprot:6965-Chlamydomonas_euryale.AAC.1